MKIRGIELVLVKEMEEEKRESEIKTEEWNMRGFGRSGESTRSKPDHSGVGL